MTDIIDATRMIRRLLLTGRTILCAHRGGYKDPTKDAVRREAAALGLDVQVVSFGYAAYLGISDPFQRRPVTPDAGEWYGLDEPGVHRGTGDEAPLGEAERARRIALAGEPRPGRMLRAPTGVPLTGPDGAFLTEATDLIDPRPLLDPSPALAGRGVLIVDGREDFGLRYLHWLARACIDAAADDGRPPPVIIGECEGIEGIAAGLGWTRAPRCDETAETADGWDGFKAPRHVAVIHPTGDRTVLGHDPTDDRVWSNRVDARLSGAVRSNDGNVWTVRGEGRIVRAIRTGPEAFDPAYPHRETVTVAEIDAAGLLTAVLITVKRRLDDAEMTDLAARCWLVGAMDAGHAERQGAKALTALLSVLYGSHPLDPGEIALRERLAEDLGPDAIAFLRSGSWGAKSVAIQFWAGTGPDASPERRQFAIAYPSLVALALDPEVTRLVDAGRPPMPRLCELMGAEPALVRRFGGESEAGPNVDMSTSRAWREVGAVLRAVGHGGLPGREGYYAWFAMFDTLRKLRALDPGHLADADIRRMVALATRLPGHSWAAKRGHLLSLPVREIRDAVDMFTSIRRWFGLLAGRDYVRSAFAFAEDYGSVERVLEASRRWHAHPALRAQTVGVPADAAWPVPFEAIALDGGHAVCLGSMEALLHEGAMGPDGTGAEGLHHCIASHAWSCLSGDGLVISFRSGTSDRYARLSTMELRPDPKGTWRIAGRPYAQIEHRGLRNVDPPDAAMSLMRKLREILDGGYPIDESALDARPDASLKMRAGAGLDLFQLWRPILPRRWARLGPEGLVASLAAEAGPAPAERAA